MIFAALFSIFTTFITLIASKTYVEGEEPNLITDINRNSIVSNLSSKNEKSTEKKDSKSDSDAPRKKESEDTSNKKSESKMALSENESKSDKSGTAKTDSKKEGKEKEKSASKDSETSTKNDDKKKESAKSKTGSKDLKETKEDKSAKSKLLDNEVSINSSEEPLKISRLIGTENPSTGTNKNELAENLFEFASKLDGSDEKGKNANILSNLASPIFGNLNESGHHGSNKDKTNLA